MAIAMPFMMAMMGTVPALALAPANLSPNLSPSLSPRPASQPASQPLSQSAPLSPSQPLRPSKLPHQREDAGVLLAQSIWKRFASTEGKFSVLFPGEPTVIKQAVPYADGQTTEINAFYLERSQEETTYAVAYNDFPFGDAVPPDLLKRAFDTGRDRMIGDAKLLNEQEITLGKFAGREFKFVNPNGKVTRARMYYVNGRLYQVMVETLREKYLTKSMEGFLSSFQLLAP